MIHMLAGLAPGIGVANFLQPGECDGGSPERGGRGGKIHPVRYFQALRRGASRGEGRAGGKLCPAAWSEGCARCAVCGENGKARLFFLNRSVDETAALELDGFGDLRVEAYIRGSSVEGGFTRETEQVLKEKKLILHPLSFAYVVEF